MKDVPKKDLPGVSGGVTTSDNVVPPDVLPFPQEPLPGPIDPIDPLRDAY